jgi:hypothetical protein
MSKKLFQVLSVLTLLALFVVACGGAQKLSDQIVGKWQYADSDLGEVVFEFQKEGKLSLTAAENSMEGTYTWVDEDTINFVFTFEGETMQPYDADLKIDGDTLTMTINGEAEVLTRVK